MGNSASDCGRKGALGLGDASGGDISGGPEFETSQGISVYLRLSSTQH
jgi:hypothetical protein